MTESVQDAIRWRPLLKREDKGNFCINKRPWNLLFFAKFMLTKKQVSYQSKLSIISALDDWLVYPQSVVLKQEYGEKEWTFDKVFDESQVNL